MKHFTRLIFCTATVWLVLGHSVAFSQFRPGNRSSSRSSALSGKPHRSSSNSISRFRQIPISGRSPSGVTVQSRGVSRINSSVIRRNVSGSAPTGQSRIIPNRGQWSGLRKTQPPAKLTDKLHRPLTIRPHSKGPSFNGKALAVPGSSLKSKLKKKPVTTVPFVIKGSHHQWKSTVKKIIHGTHNHWCHTRPAACHWWVSYCRPIAHCHRDRIVVCDWNRVVCSVVLHAGHSATDVQWYLGLKGIVLPGKGLGIDTVEPGSPADRVGLKPGMVMTVCNGIPLIDEVSMQEAIRTSGGILNMTLLSEDGSQVLEGTVQMIRVATVSF